MTSSSSLYGSVTQQNVSSSNSTSLYGEAGTPIPDSSGNVVVRGDLLVLSGNILTTAATGNIFPTNATTINLGNAATTVNIGADSGTLNFAGDTLVLRSTSTGQGNAVIEVNRGGGANNPATLTWDEAYPVPVSSNPNGRWVTNCGLTATGLRGGYVEIAPNTFDSLITTTTGSGLNLILESDTNIIQVNGDLSVVNDITADSGTFSNITVGLSTNNTITTTSGNLILDSATNIVQVNANLTVSGTDINLAQGTSFLYDEINNRANRPEVQSTTGNNSGWRVLAPNATTSASSTFVAVGSNDIDNGSFFAVRASGSTTAPFTIATGAYSSGILAASGKSINIVDGSTLYASINPAGPTISTDLTTKAYVDAQVDSNTTYTIDASTTTGGANFNLVGSDATTDTVKFASGTGITVSRTDANTITITNNDPGSTGVTSITGTANQVIVSSPTGAITLSTPQDIATTSNPTFAGATLGTTTVGVATDNTITTTSGNLILDGFTNIVEVNANLTVDGADINLAQGTTFLYDESGSRVNRPEFQSTTGNNSGVRVLGPNATTSSSSTFVAVGSNDIDNGQYLAIRATGSTTAPFAIASGVYTGGIQSASGKSINIIDGTTTYATINPAGPTVGTDLTTKTYVDGLIPTVVTYDYNATSTTGGANLNLVGSNATTDTVKLTNGNHITATYASGTEVTLGSDATDANTASTIVARDASGNFNAGTVSLAGQLISTRANNTADGAGQIFLNGSGGNRIDWVATGTGAPAFTTRTAGTKAVLYPALSGSQVDYALGIDAATLWSSVPVNSTSFKFKWYGGQTEIASLDGTGNLVVSGNVNSAGATLGNVTVGVDTDNTISTSSGNLTLQTAAGVNAGTLVLTAGANGAITLAPNGTGNVVNTFSNGGNLTNNRNYVAGAIRNATTQSIGDIWAVNSTGAVQPFRGVSIDNSADTSKNAGYLARNYSNTAGFRSRLIFERARGTAATPTAIQAGDFLGEVCASGYTSTGWLNDNIAAVTPAFFGFAAQENWVSNTALGTAFTLSLAPTTTTITSAANLINCFSITPQTFACRSDAFTWANGKTGTTQTMALDVSGNLTVTGDVRINGNDIQGSGGVSAITLTSANTATTVRGDTINLQTAASVALPSGQISYGRQYGDFSSLVSQTNPVANAENLMIFGTTNANNGVTIVSNGTALTRITFANAGIYNLQFSAQLSQSAGGAHNSFIWIKKNGTTVANTAGDTRIAGNGDRIMASWNYIVTAVAGDYYELAWAASDTSVILEYVAASGVVPGIPSTALTVTPVGA